MKLIPFDAKITQRLVDLMEKKMPISGLAQLEEFFKEFFEKIKLRLELE